MSIWFTTPTFKIGHSKFDIQYFRKKECRILNVQYPMSIWFTTPTFKIEHSKFDIQYSEKNNVEY